MAKDWCRAHNYFHAPGECPRCATRVIEAAGRLPYRVTHPHPRTRCHRCWNLVAVDARGTPVCKCRSDLTGPGGTLPGADRALSLEEAIADLLEAARRTPAW